MINSSLAEKLMPRRRRRLTMDYRPAEDAPDLEAALAEIVPPAPAPQSSDPALEDTQQPDPGNEAAKQVLMQGLDAIRSYDGGAPLKPAALNDVAGARPAVLNAPAAAPDDPPIQTLGGPPEIWNPLPTKGDAIVPAGSADVPLAANMRAGFTQTPMPETGVGRELLQPSDSALYGRNDFTQPSAPNAATPDSSWTVPQVAFVPKDYGFTGAMPDRRLRSLQEVRSDVTGQPVTTEDVGPTGFYGPVPPKTPPVERAPQYQGDTGPVDPFIYEKPRTLAEYDDRIAQLENTRTPREKSFWKRLGKGLFDGWVGWAQSGGQGGLGGLLGAIGTGGAIYAASPGAHADMRKREELQKLFGQRQTQAAIEDDEINRNYRRMQTERPADDRKARLELEATRQKNRLEVINRQADVRSGEARIFVDENGYVWKQFLKPGADGKLRPNEPVVNPTNGEQEIAVGEQTVDWYDPYTKQWVKVKAKQILNPGATIATGNATRTQQATITQAQLDYNAQKENVDNEMKYQSDVIRLAEEQGKAEGKELEALAEMRGYRDQMAQIASALDATPEYDTDGRNKLLKELGEVQAKFEEAVGKNESGRTLRTKLDQQGVSRPKKIVPIRIEASTVTAPSTPTGAVSEAVFKDRLKANNIPESEWPAYVAKAKRDGVVR